MRHAILPSEGDGRVATTAFDMASTPVIIIGAGIAGPALGIALRRAGFEAVVYETHAAPRDNAGAFLNLAPNGLSVLRALGVSHVVDDVGFRNDRLTFRNDAGRVLASAPVGGITLMRGALSCRLREAAQEAGVRFAFGKAVASVVPHRDRVIAHFADGSAVSGRALIGADGIHSRVRASVFEDAPAPAYTGIVNLGGITTTDLPSTGSTMQMVFGRRAFFGYAVRPNGDTYWFSNFAQRDEPAREGLLQVAADRYREQLLTLHRDDPPEVTRILRSVTADIGAYAVYDMPSMPAWRRGAACLIGDASHAIGPHVGQGASLALEDAFVAAKCLRDVGDPSVAFETFERLRRDRVEPIVRHSRRTGRQKVPTGWIGRKIRDAVLPMFLRKGAEAAQQMYQYHAQWDEVIGVANAVVQGSGASRTPD